MAPVTVARGPTSNPHPRGKREHEQRDARRVDRVQQMPPRIWFTAGKANVCAHDRDSAKDDQGQVDSYDVFPPECSHQKLAKVGPSAATTEHTAPMS